MTNKRNNQLGRVYKDIYYMRTELNVTFCCDFDMFGVDCL